MNAFCFLLTHTPNAFSFPLLLAFPQVNFIYKMELQEPGRRMKNSKYILENNNTKAGVILVKLQYIVQYSDIWLWYSNIIWSAVKKRAENIRQPLDPTCSHQRNTPLLYVNLSSLLKSQHQMHAYELTLGFHF